MKEITLNHRELTEILQLIEAINPPDSLMLAAGTVKIVQDSSSGIGSIVSATLPVKVGDRWGDWSTRITDERHW